MNDPIIVEKQELTLCGVERHIGGKQSERPALAEAMWRELEADGTLDKLRALSWGESALALVNRNFTSSGYDRMLCALCPNAEGFTQLTLPAGTFAVFTAEDKEAADKLWDEIYFKWFKRSGYDHSGGSEVEIFYPDRVEIWVPIKEAKAAPEQSKRRGEFLPQLIFMIAGLLLGSILGRGAEAPAVYMVGGVCVGAVVGWLWGKYRRRNDKSKQENKTEPPEKKENE